jgi:peptidoglycan hydrolase CwlO-like protein
MELISGMNPLNAKAKSKEIAALLDDYVPGVEELMTKLKKTSKAAKEMRSEIANLKKEVNSSKASTLRQLELEKKVQEFDDLQHMVESLQKMVDAIPAEILDVYRDSKPDRKETIIVE